MDKYYSYTDFLKAVEQSKSVNNEEKLLNEIYLDLFLNRIERIHREEKLEELIDIALDQKDEQAFYTYAQELNDLRQEEIELSE